MPCLCPGPSNTCLFNEAPQVPDSATNDNEAPQVHLILELFPFTGGAAWELHGRPPKYRRKMQEPQFIRWLRLLGGIKY